MREAPVDLTVHDHRIDQLAAIFDDHIVENFDIADVRIDRDQGSVGGIAEGARVLDRLVSDGGLETARIDVVRKVLRFQVPGAGDLAETDGALGTDHLAGVHRHAVCIRLQELRTDLDGALGDLLACGRHRPASHHHAARAPGPG